MSVAIVSNVSVCGINPGDVVNALSCIHVYLYADFIGVGIVEGGEGQLEILGVLFGPCGFCSKAINDLTHG